MSDIYTLPDPIKQSLNKKLLPAYMRPNDIPMAVVFRGQLGDDECDAIIEHGMMRRSYKVNGCNAKTRECPRPLDAVLQGIVNCGMAANELYWGFDIDQAPAAWLQTYESGDLYHRHMDASFSQSRKLTAVALLSDPHDYTGGFLTLFDPHDQACELVNTRGTVIVFPSWTMHEVYEITGGKRQTINMGWWGPPFK